jgi:cytochrome c-type biogenesis protein CcmH/NrfG
MMGKEKVKKPQIETSRPLLIASRSSSRAFLVGGARLGATVVPAVLCGIIAIGAIGLGPINGTSRAYAAGSGGENGQDAMIRGMVERLAARLKENAADFDGWLMLIRSYSVLKENSKMEEAEASARKQFASEPEKLEKIASLTRDLSQAAPAKDDLHASAKPVPGAQAAENGGEKGQDAMIRGQVERLATRLKENAADLDGWLMLIRSYSVLKENSKMEEAAASARGQFASEPEALDKIASLTRQLGQAAPVNSDAQASGPAAQELPTIEHMVERLAARLKGSGGDLDSWVMLIRSYAVLKDAAKVQEAAASARKQFASEPSALDKIDTLIRGLELPSEEGKGQPKL